MEMTNAPQSASLDNTAAIRDQIALELSTMPLEKLQRVLDYVQLVNGTLQGEPGWQLVEHARSLGFTAEDVREMQEAIEAEFGYHEEALDVNNNE